MIYMRGDINTYDDHLQKNKKTFLISIILETQSGRKEIKVEKWNFQFIKNERNVFELSSFPFYFPPEWPETIRIFNLMISPDLFHFPATVNFNI